MSPARRLFLASSEVHVWLAYPDDIAEPTLLGRYCELLSPEEQARHAGFAFEHDRRLYLVAHALLRCSLSRYAVDIAPATWHFVTNAYGRPELHPDLCEALSPLFGASSRLRFSLSHTRGLAACAVTLDRDVGVDVEHAENRRGDWSLKEAYVKARGMGLSLPVEHIIFERIESGNSSVPGQAHMAFQGDLAANLQDDPQAWQFAEFLPTPHHTLALAMRRRPGEKLQTRVRSTTPLED